MVLPNVVPYLKISHYFVVGYTANVFLQVWNVSTPLLGRTSFCRHNDTTFPDKTMRFFETCVCIFTGKAVTTSFLLQRDFPGSRTYLSHWIKFYWLLDGLHQFPNGAPKHLWNPLFRKKDLQMETFAISLSHFLFKTPSPITLAC